MKSNKRIEKLKERIQLYRERLTKKLSSKKRIYYIRKLEDLNKRLKKIN